MIKFNKEHQYKRIFPGLSSYTTCFNAIKMGYPFMESITSMLGFSDELIIVDHSTDGTKEILQEMAGKDNRIKLYDSEWESDRPTMDGDAKAFSRALCEKEFCWQFDLDEVVAERDYEKIRWMTKRFPTQAPVLHLPVAEVWGHPNYCTGRRHSWKWRLSRNLPEITHGVNKYARLTKEDGTVYAKEGMSDGCEYIHQVTFEPIPHVGFYTQEAEQARVSEPEQFAAYMNKVIENIPTVFHYSWLNLDNKINQFKENWHQQWNALYQLELPQRFEAGTLRKDIVSDLYETGGEPADQLKYKFEIDLKYHPKIMEKWLKDNIKYLEYYEIKDKAA